MPSISSDILIKFIYYSSLIVFLTTIIMMFLVLVYRFWSIRQKKQIKNFNQKWTSFFEKKDNLVLFTLPVLNKKDKFLLLKLWSDIYETADSKKKKYLKEFAIQLKFIDVIATMIHSKNGYYNMLAIRSLGHLKDTSLNPKLYEFTYQSNPFLSLIAAHALIKISPKESMEKLILYFISQEDLLVDKVIFILSEVKLEILEKSLMDSIIHTKHKYLPRLIRLLKLLPDKKSYSIAKGLLLKHTDSEIISAALRYINNKEDKSLILSYIQHNSWIVRLRAVQALTHLVNADDKDSFLLLLSDKVWWVRYNISNILISQDFANRQYLEDLKSSLNDQFALDTITNIISKRNAFESK